MENASHALIIAFSILIFIIALTVAIVSFTEAKATADVVLYTKDETNYYEYMGATGKASQNRIVGLETIIPTLYKYQQENYSVVFKEGNYNEETGEITNWKYRTMYETKKQRKWRLTYTVLMNAKYGLNMSAGDNDNRIFSFDIEEETARNEPWAGNATRIRDNLDHFLSGEVYYNPNESGNIEYINYKTNTYCPGGFVKWCNSGNKKFVETITEYEPGGVQANDRKDRINAGEMSKTTKANSKRMIIFTLIN